MNKKKNKNIIWITIDENEIVSADIPPEEELVTGELDMESINALAAADENEDDYSFLNDDWWINIMSTNFKNAVSTHMIIAQRGLQHFITLVIYFFSKILQEKIWQAE